MQSQSIVAAAVVLLPLAAACGQPADPPEPVAPALVAEAATTPPVHALIGHREALDLTSEQIEALDSIGSVLHERNAPLERELRTLPRREAQRQPRRSRTGERREPAARFADPEAARELIAEIAENNREAARAVGEVLSQAQRERVCEGLMDTPRARRAEDAPVRLSPWPWCGPDAAQADTAGA